jgi:putative ABC transport system permease protein
MGPLGSGSSSTSGACRSARGHEPRAVDWEASASASSSWAEPAPGAAPHSLLAAANVAPEREAHVQSAARACCGDRDPRARDPRRRCAACWRALGLAGQLLGTFTVLVGIVLLAGVASLGALRRVREVALWKVLGVTRAGVARLFALEFALLGLVAGVLGAAAASTLAWAFFEHVLELGSDVPWWTVPAAGALAAALAALCGLAACVRALQARPIESLRG